MLHKIVPKKSITGKTVCYANANVLAFAVDGAEH